MKLVYTSSGDEVQVGDTIDLLNGDQVVVVSFNKPHKPSSSGKVIVRAFGDVGEWACREFYVGVIGAEWVEREDRV